MSIFPEDDSTLDNIIEDTIQSEELPLLKEYAWDFEKNDFVLIDGKFKVVEGREALKIWICKALKTPRYRHLAYTFEYGNEFDDLIGKNFSTEFVQSEIQRLLEECLLINPYILNINKIKTSTQKDILQIEATIKSVYGEVNIHV